MALREYRWPLVSILAPPLLLAGTLLAVEKLNRSAPDGGLPGMASTLNMVLLLIPLALLLLGLLALVYVRTRKLGAYMLASCVLFTAVSFAVTQLRSNPLDAYRALAERSTPLVEAIHQYARARGEPPAELAHLAPEFIDAVPGTGMDAHPEYHYTTDPGQPYVGDNPWMLYVPIAESPRQWLIYLPSGSYRHLPGAYIALGDWALVYAQYQESDGGQ